MGGESLLINVWILAHNQFSSILGQLGLDLQSMNPLMGTATAAALGLGAGIIAIGGLSIKAASEYQTQFARIVGLTGSTQEQLDYYNKTLIQTAANYDMTSADAAKALYFIISAGLDPLGSAMERAKFNMDTLKYSSMAATASLADQATVADTMTSIMKAYGSSNITASDAANTLTRIETYGKATLSAFASSLGFTMTTGKAAGVAMHEVAAAVANLTQVAGQHGARRIQMEFDNLMRSLLDINAIAKRAKAEGLNFDAASFSTMTLIGKLQYLQHLTGALSSNINDQTYSQMVNMDATKNQLAATAKLDLELDKSNSNFMKLTGGAAAFIPATILLSDKAKSYTDILAQMESRQDTVTAAFNNMRNTLGQTVKMLEMRLQSILIVIGQQLLPTLTNMGKWFTTVAMHVLTFIQSTDGMEKVKTTLLGLAIIIGAFVVPAILHMVLAALPFIAMMAALIAAGYLVGKVLQTHPQILHAIQTALGTVAAAVGAVIGKLGQFTAWVKSNEVALTVFKYALAVLAVLLAGYLISAIVSAVVTAYSFATAMLTVATSLWTAAAGALALEWPIILVVALLAALALGIYELVSHWTQVKQFFGNIKQAIGDFLGSAGRTIGGWFSSLGTHIHNGLSLAGQAIGSFFAALPGRLMFLGQLILHAAIDWITKLPERAAWGFGYMVGTIIKLVLFLLLRLPVLLWQLAGAALGIIGTLVGHILGAIGAMIGNVLGAIGRLSDQAPEMFLALATQIGVWIALLVIKVKQRFEELKVEAIIRVTALVNTVIAWFQALPARALVFMTNLVNGAIQKAIDLYHGIVTEIQQLPGQAITIIGSFIQGLINGIGSGAQWVLQAIQNLGSSMINGFKSALGIHSPSAVMHQQGLMIGQGLANGLLAAQSTVNAAWRQMTGGLTAPTVGNPALAGAAGQGVVRAAPLLSGGGGGGNTYHITMDTSGIKDHKALAEELRRMLDQRERDNYRAGKRPGGYQGFRSGI